MFDKNLSIPMYKQIASELRQEISQYHRDEVVLIPSQKELVERFAVSLITVRKALDCLVEEGLIVRKAGKGTFTTGKVMKDHLSALRTVGEVVGRAGAMQEARIVVKEMRFVRTEDLPKLKFAEELGEEVLYIVRTHVLDDTPVSLSEIYIPKKYGHFFSKELVEAHDTYRIFTHQGGIKLGYGKQVMKANAAGPLIAKHLMVPQGYPVFQFERRSYSASNQLIEYIVNSFEYSKYELEIEMELGY